MPSPSEPVLGADAVFAGNVVVVVVVERSVAEARVAPAPTSALLITIPTKSRTAPEDAATEPFHSATLCTQP